MKAVNRFKIARFHDYIVLRLGFSDSKDPEDMGDSVEEFVLPLTTVTSLAMKMWDTIIRSTADLTEFFTGIQKPMEDLNKLSAQMDRKKAELAVGADASTVTEAAPSKDDG